MGRWALRSIWNSRVRVIWRRFQGGRAAAIRRFASLIGHDQGFQTLRRENDAALFDEEAKRRLGEAFSRSMRQGNSEFS